jgi:hypothetical protein
MSRGVYVNSWSIRKAKTRRTVFILFTRLFLNHLTSEHKHHRPCFNLTRSCWCGTCFFFFYLRSIHNEWVYIDATNPKLKNTTTQFPESSHMHLPSQLKDCEAGEWLPPNCHAQRNWILCVPTRLVKFNNKIAQIPLQMLRDRITVGQVFRDWFRATNLSCLEQRSNLT